MNPLNTCKTVKDERTHPYSLQPLLPRSKVKDIIRNYKAISVMNSVMHAFEKIIKRFPGKWRSFLVDPNLPLSFDQFLLSL